MSDIRERDPEIADALASIEAPEHRPTFWADLHKRLDAETAVRRDEQVGATVTSIAPAPAAKVPAHAPGHKRLDIGEARLDTGELPSVRSLSHERTRRRSRAPWLAIAAGFLVLVGAVGVVTLAGEQAGDDDDGGAELADAPTGTSERAAEVSTTVAEPAATSTTATPDTTSPTTVGAAADTPDGAVRQWLDHLATGEVDAAAAQLGPRTMAFLSASGADPVGMMSESQEGYGAWTASPDLEVVATSLGTPPQLGTELAVVTVSGTFTGEGADTFQVAAVPVVREADGWRIEHLAHVPARNNSVVFTVPTQNDDGTLNPLDLDEINVFVPSFGTVYFLVDGGAPVEKTTTPVGANDEPFALVAPDPRLAPGLHRIVVVAVGDDGSITSYGGTFPVAG